MGLRAKNIINYYNYYKIYYSYKTNCLYRHVLFMVLVRWCIWFPNNSYNILHFLKYVKNILCVILSKQMKKKFNPE